MEQTPEQGHRENGSRYYAWLLVLPVSLLLLAVLRYVLPLFVRVPPEGYGADLFLESTVPSLLPEPLEQVGYLVAITLAPLCVAAAVRAIRRHQRLSEALRGSDAFVWWVIFSQFAVLLFAVVMWKAQLVSQKVYFCGCEMTAVALLSAGMVLALFGRKARAGTSYLLRLGDRLPVLAYSVAAELVCIWLLLPSLFTDANISDSLINVRAHIPFIVDEFSAVLNGRHILVDYFPQYQKLLSYVLEPYFKLFGAGTLSFTVCMAILSLFSLMCVYFTFALLSRRRLLVLALFVLFLGSCAVPTNISGVNLFYMFNYYPMGPVRYMAPWVMGLLLAFYLRYPSVSKLWAMAAAGAFFMLNNPDFGVPASAGVLAALALGRDGSMFAPWAFVRRAGLAFAAALASAVLIFDVATRMAAGQWPRFGEMFMYQKVFAATGFMLLPMPAAGLHWLIYATFMCGIAVAVFWAVFGRSAGEREDCLPPLLMFGCVAGCGIGMYYVGRSHPYVLPAVFPAWSFVLALLLLFSARLRQHGKRVVLLGAIPAFMLVFHLLVLGSPLLKFPGPLGQLKRLASGSGEFINSYEVLAELTRRNTMPGEKVGIVSMYSHNLALAAGVDNVYPFAHRGSLLLKSQVQLAMDVLEKNGVNRVFGVFPAEMERALEADGFKPTPLVSNGVYTMWRRVPQ